MRNIMLTIEYEGTAYGGWQKQKNALSIQGAIEEAIFKITGEKANLTASGRTDAGVHALGQVANFKTSTKIPIERISKAINAKLPENIGIIEAKEVSLDFHARYNAKRKTYQYRILNSDYKRPIYRNFTYYVPHPLDFDQMKKDAMSLIGEHDFKGFMSSGSSVKSTIRKIYGVDLEKKEDIIILEIEGNGFLYNMVRIIVGTLIDIGKGKINMPLREIVASGDRSKGGHTAPSTGLFLKKVYYNLDTPGSMY